MPFASSSGTCGRRMKVAMPPKRGVTMPDMGWLNFLFSLFAMAGSLLDCAILADWK